MNKPFLSIILPTYNRLYSLKAISLPSLEKQNFDNFELIIIDDCSSDGTKEYFSGKQFERDFPKLSSRTTYQRNSKNKGAPGSRNIGANHAKASWLYIIEDDIKIEKSSYLSDAKNVLCEVDKNTAVVSPKREESVLKGYYNNPRNSFARVGFLSGEIYIDPTQEYSGFVPNTHASSFVRTDIYKANLEDEQLFFGNTFRDESDLYLRIVKNGNKIFYCGDKLKTIHRNDFAKSGGQKKINNKSIFFQEYSVVRNHYLFLRKNFNLSFLRIGFFVIIRVLKIISNFLKINSLKNFLSLVRF